MSMSNTFENELALLIFNNTNAAGIGDATGLRGSSTAGSFYVSAHTANPGETGTQATSEVTYTGNARTAVARSGSGFTVSGNNITNAAAITLGACTAGTDTITHWGLGDDSSGAGKLRYYGPIIAASAVWLPFTAKTDDTITVPGHSFSVDDRAVIGAAYSGTLPTGSTAGTVYFVKTVSGNDITISTTSGGSAVDLTAVGSGVIIEATTIAVSNNITPQFAAGQLNFYLD